MIPLLGHTYSLFQSFLGVLLEGHFKFRERLRKIDLSLVKLTVNQLYAVSFTNTPPLSLYSSQLIMSQKKKLHYIVRLATASKTCNRPREGTGMG